jgi:hypothetical protein
VLEDPALNTRERLRDRARRALGESG